MLTDMLTEMQRQFVEVAARTWLAVTHGAEYHLGGYGDECNECSGGGVVQRSVHYEMADFPCPYVTHSAEALGIGHYLVGKLEGVNDTTIDQIVSAANRAVTDILITTDCPDHWHCDPAAAPHRCEVDRTKPCATCGLSVFDPGALFRAIVLEALGQGSVRETFGEIRIPLSHCADCGLLLTLDPENATPCGESGDHHVFDAALVIPRITVEGATR